MRNNFILRTYVSMLEDAVIKRYHRGNCEIKLDTRVVNSLSRNTRFSIVTTLATVLAVLNSLRCEKSGLQRGNKTRGPAKCGFKSRPYLVFRAILAPDLRRAN